MATDTIPVRSANGLDVYLAEVRRLPPPSAAEEARLLRRIGLGDSAALDELAVRNLGLVADIVVRDHADHDSIVARLDRGNQALLEAIASFPSSGHRDFRAYVRSHIQRTMRRASA